MINVTAVVIRKIDWRMATSVFEEGFDFRASKTNLKAAFDGCQGVANTDVYTKIAR